LQDKVVTVVIPTLVADKVLQECVDALQRQTLRDFEIVIVDNSGAGLVRRNHPTMLAAHGPHLIENVRNVGFGTAINQAVAATRSTLIATLNDDAVPHPGWLEALVAAIGQRPDAGMCASQVRLCGEPALEASLVALLDSAGMLVAADGSSKQRGHGQDPQEFPVSEEALFPSASAALYRRTMLESIGGFDENFFLYCEDTDLGLRARWAGWKCLYVAEAVVEHRYSHSAGRASPVKAYYVERNRLFVMAKNFPWPMLLAAPFTAVTRYFWHTWYLMKGRGAAAHFRAAGHAGSRMPWYVLRAHFALVLRSVALWRQRRQIRAHARITPAVFRLLLRCHSISTRKVAAL
jgi:GT2 family glycosyltransferase